MAHRGRCYCAPARGSQATPGVGRIGNPSYDPVVLACSRPLPSPGERPWVRIPSQLNRRKHLGTKSRPRAPPSPADSAWTTGGSARRARPCTHPGKSSTGAETRGTLPKNLEKSVGRAAHISRRSRIDYWTKITRVLHLREVLGRRIKALIAVACATDCKRIRNMDRII